MRIAISIPDDIYRWVNKEASLHHKSRSNLIVTALSEYRQRQKNHMLLKSINTALDEIESGSEVLPALKQKHVKLISRADRY